MWPSPWGHSTRHGLGKESKFATLTVQIRGGDSRIHQWKAREEDGGSCTSCGESMEMLGIIGKLQSSQAWHDRSHLKYRVMPSKVGKRMRGNDFMRRSLA